MNTMFEIMRAFGGQDRFFGARGARPFAEPVARDHHWPHDLGGGEIAHKPLRRWQNVRERTADLREETQRCAASASGYRPFRSCMAFAGGFPPPPARAICACRRWKLVPPPLRPRQRVVLGERRRSVFETLVISRSRVPRK